MSTRRTIKLTKKDLEDLPFGLGWVNIIDSQIARLRVNSGKSKKTIYLRRRVSRGDIHFKVCVWESGLSPELIRAKAIKVATQVIEGDDPNLEKKSVKHDDVLLGDAFERLMQTRARGKNAFKKSTEEQYRYSWKTDLRKWSEKPLSKITGDMAEKLHRDRSKTSKSRANMAIRLLRMIFKFAMEVYRDEEGRPIVLYNPADRITTLKLQNKICRRTGHISKEQLKPWFHAVLNNGDQIIADMFIFTIMTGLRRNEASQLTWDRVDLEKKTYRIIENKSKRPVELPLSDYLFKVLERRKLSAGVRRYVFPAGIKSSYLKDWRNRCDAIRRLTEIVDDTGNIIEPGIAFMPHDLRRTFITVAESLDISPYSIKALVNHALPSDDVTGGYIQIDAERLREPMQKITDKILELADIY